MIKHDSTSRTGHAELYLRLLKGEISAKEYAASVRKTVNRQIRERPRTAKALSRVAS